MGASGAVHSRERSQIIVENNINYKRGGDVSQESAKRLKQSSVVGFYVVFELSQNGFRFFHWNEYQELKYCYVLLLRPNADK